MSRKPEKVRIEKRVRARKTRASDLMEWRLNFDRPTVNKRTISRPAGAESKR